MNWAHYVSYVTSVVREIDDNPWTLTLGILAVVAAISIVFCVLLTICHSCCKCCRRVLCKKSSRSKTKNAPRNPRQENDETAQMLPVNPKNEGNDVEQQTELQMAKQQPSDDTKEEDIVLKDPIKRVLVTVLCISEYDGDVDNASKFPDLTNVPMDKKHMIDLWGRKYRYDMVINEPDRYSLADGQKLLRKAAKKFAEADYECIIMIYSGHGDEKHIYFSDYRLDHKGHFDYSKMSRVELTNYFDGNHVKSKVDAYKLYFIDACRGNRASKAVSVKIVQNDVAQHANDDDDDGKEAQIASKCLPKGKFEMRRIHADSKRMMFWPNTEQYMSFDTKNGGILLNSLYETLMDDKNDNKSLGQLKDKIKKKGDVLIKINRDGQDVESKCCVETADTMSFSELSSFRFAVDDTGIGAPMIYEV